MQKGLIFGFTVLLAVGFLGCSDDRTALAPDAVIVSVDGEALTRADIERMADLFADFELLTAKNSSAANVERIKRQYMESAPSGFVERTLFKHVAKDLKLTVSDAECDRQIGYTLKIIGAGKGSKNPMAMKFTEERIGLLRASTRDELLAQKGRAALLRESKNIPESEIKLRYKQIEDYNRAATLTNALIAARATNVWERLVAAKGTNFVELVKNFSEEEGDPGDGDWGEWCAGDLSTDDKPLVDRLLGMNPGQFTPPMECDNGLAIVRLNDRRMVAKKKDASSDMSPMVNDWQFRLSRIYFRQALLYKMPTRDELIATLKEINRNEFFAKEMARLRRQAKIEWPNGEDAVHRILPRVAPGGRLKDLPSEVRQKLPDEMK